MISHYSVLMFRDYAMMTYDDFRRILRHVLNAPTQHVFSTRGSLQIFNRSKKIPLLGYFFPIMVQYNETITRL